MTEGVATTCSYGSTVETGARATGASATACTFGIGTVAGGGTTLGVTAGCDALLTVFCGAFIAPETADGSGTTPGLEGGGTLPIPLLAGGGTLAVFGGGTTDGVGAGTIGAVVETGATTAG